MRCVRAWPPRGTLRKRQSQSQATQATRSGGGAFLLVQAERHVVAHRAEAAALRVEGHAPHLRGRGAGRDSAEGSHMRRVPRVALGAIYVWRGAVGAVRVPWVRCGCHGVPQGAEGRRAGRRLCPAPLSLSLSLSLSLTLTLTLALTLTLSRTWSECTSLKVCTHCRE